MKTTLTIQESIELIKRGVSADKASKRVTRQVADSRGREIEKLRLKRWKDCVPYEKATMTNLHVGLMRFEHKEIFTLVDLLTLLPKEITVKMEFYDVDRLACLHISSTNKKWYVSYKYEFEEREYWCKMFNSEELIDALYKLLLWAIDRNHVKLG